MESRSTFREIVTDEAWQYKVRKEREAFYSGKKKIWDGIDTTLKKAVVRPVTRKQAEKIIFEYEWLGTLPTCGLYYGIFFENILGGVSCISLGNSGAGSHKHEMFGIERNKLAYLVRGACAYWTPKGSASKLISWSLKFCREKGAKVIIAYADSDAGEYGTVYQSTNWLCLGKGSSVDEWVSKSGKIVNCVCETIYSRRSMVSNLRVREEFFRRGWRKQKGNKKTRYCYILADCEERERIYERIKPLISPYPKRPCAQSIENDATLIQKERAV